MPADRETRLVVLDDDPTGTQSVHDLPVLTSWEPEDLRWALATGAAAVYVMTNSRSLDPGEAERVTREVVRSAVAAAEAEDVRLEIVSRSDSTLRGHFPLEPRVIREELAAIGSAAVPVPEAILLVPAFPEAGRVTLDGVHYVGDPAHGGVPVGRSEFAGDATFGFRSSRLADWVQEKTDGAIPASAVAHLDLETLRAGGERAAAALRAALGAPVITADALTEDDLRALAQAVRAVRAEGAHLLFRVGPPFVRSLIDQEAAAPLSAERLAAIMAEGPAAAARGGLVVVGSHVDLTTRQLAHARAHPPTGTELAEVVLEVPELLGEGRAAHLREAARRAIMQLEHGIVVLGTSRERIEGADREASLAIARAVSDAVVQVVREVLAAAPLRFVIAKGGITSSDVASRGLGIGRAVVRGPMLPGIVSLWDPIDGPAAHIPYVVFAGNVGDETSLAEVIGKLG